MAKNRLLLPRLILGLAVFCVVLDSCAAGEWFCRLMFGDAYCDQFYPRPCECPCPDDTYRYRRIVERETGPSRRRRCAGTMAYDTCRPYIPPQYIGYYG